jgi:hypothetical protein
MDVYIFSKEKQSVVGKKLQRRKIMMWNLTSNYKYTVCAMIKIE